MAICKTGGKYMKFDPILPKGYQVVKCLTSDGYQWINTGITPLPYINFEGSFSVNNFEASDVNIKYQNTFIPLIGTYDEINEVNYPLTTIMFKTSVPEEGSWYITSYGYPRNKTIGYKFTDTLLFNKLYNYHIIFDQENKRVSLFGGDSSKVEYGNFITKDMSPADINPNVNNTFHFFKNADNKMTTSGMMSASTFNASIGRVRMLNRDNSKIADFVPCLDVDGRPCFFDLVSQKPFYNEGAGEFTWEEL